MQTQLRDQLHDLKVGQESLPTRDDIVEEIASQRTSDSYSVAEIDADVAIIMSSIHCFAGSFNVAVR